MVETLGVAVLGAGAWAHHAHIPGWQRDPRSRVVAICDVRRDLAEAYRTEFGIAEATDDWQSVIARTDIDVVDIVTPSETHYELACAALKAGTVAIPITWQNRRRRAAG